MVELDSTEQEEWTSISSETCSYGRKADKSSRGSNCNKTTMVEKPLGELSSKVQLLFERIQRMAVKEEEHIFRLSLPPVSTDGCVSIAERDSAVSTIKSMQRFYNFGSDTLAAAVTYMDRFLSKVKVKTRYLSCVAAASFFLSTKMNEEMENSPTATDLSHLNRKIWKASDLKRMEKVILEKLEWNLFPCITSLSFLHTMFELLQLVNQSIDKQFYNLLLQRIELFINYTSCASYKVSTLALSTIHQCLKEHGLSDPATTYLLLHVQAVCKVSDSELWDCQCTTSNQLELCNFGSATRPRCLPLPKLNPRPNLVIRPSYYGMTDLPTIQEVPWGVELREQTPPDASYVPYPTTLALSCTPCLIQAELSFPPKRCFVTEPRFSETFGAYYNQCNKTV